MADELLKRLYNACNPYAPATPGQYVDSDAARGNKDVAEDILSQLDKLESGEFLCYLFSGHWGCGKSSELRHVAEQLKRPDREGGRFLPVIVDADEYLDYEDADPMDLLLSLLAEFARVVEDDAGIAIRSSYVVGRLREAGSFLTRRVQVDELKLRSPEIPSFGSLAVDFKLLRTDPKNRDLVRGALNEDVSSLRREIELKFEEVRVALRRKGEFRDFVLILDNLEKLSQVSGKKPGDDSHREFFLQRANQLAGLAAHVIYTVPLPLVLSDGPLLQVRYGCPPSVLPMIKVENRGDHSQCEAGYTALRHLVQRRVGADHPWESAITKEAADFLIKYSGGHLRIFMTMLRETAARAKTTPVTLADAEEGIGSTVETMARMPAAYWAKLAAVEIGGGTSLDTADPDYRKMLQMAYVLEYRNGENSLGKFQRKATWYAVHPILRELDSFNKAVVDLRAAASGRG